MKNINIKKVLMLSLLVGTLFSCNKDDGTLENVRLTKSVVTLDRTTDSAIEGNAITFTLNVDTPYKTAMDYKIEVYDEGTTASFRDFTCSERGVMLDETTTDQGGFPQGKIGYILQVPAFATSTTFTIKPTKDLLKEGNEVLKLRLVSSGNGLLKINPNSEILTINIADYVSNDVGISLTWDKSTNWFGTIVDRPYLGTDDKMHDTSLFDYDMYIYDSSGTDITANVAATGNNPEFFELLATQPNDVYDVYFEIYATGLIRPKAAFNEDIQLTISKYGVWSTTIKVPLDTNNNFGAVVAQITKTGNSYVVTDYNTNAVLASGKMANKKINILRNK
jgi:hypothetical protein